MSIPKPGKEQQLQPDRRMEYLKEWKRIFEAIDSRVKATIYGEISFEERLQNCLGNIDFLFDTSDVKLVVELPEELQLQYLVGLINNEMFSQEEVFSDPLLEENEYYPCEPKTEGWQYFYEKVCDIADTVRKNIPLPPKDLKNT